MLDTMWPRQWSWEESCLHNLPVLSLRLLRVVCSNPPEAMCVVLAKRGLLGTLCPVAILHRQGPSLPLLALQSVPEQ